ncbi:hypothetical protein [Kineococcus arenarius]|uniref:hypothetical protein n=1 Tax=Kineococcus sp. SYSU DK007 TaxID=3383128 RepID=UPI003D7DC111
MPDLRLDTSRLSASATDLDAVAAALSRTDAVADGVAEVVGHSGLAGALREFADSSTRRRTELGETLEQFAARLREAVTGFEEREQQLAATARGDASGAS